MEKAWNPGSEPWRVGARISQLKKEKSNSRNASYWGRWQLQVERNLLRGGLEPPDPVTVVALLAAYFGSRGGGALGVFSAPADVVPAAPLPELPTPVTTVAIWAANFGPEGAPGAFLAHADVVPVALQLEPPEPITAVAI
jgi:hypothetical protein